MKTIKPDWRTFSGKEDYEYINLDWVWELECPNAAQSGLRTIAIMDLTKRLQSLSGKDEVQEPVDKDL
jgi:hypothetical protein